MIWINSAFLAVPEPKKKIENRENKDPERLKKNRKRNNLGENARTMQRAAR
jgi:hypothetical protein